MKVCLSPLDTLLELSHMATPFTPVKGLAVVCPGRKENTGVAV